MRILGIISERIESKDDPVVKLFLDEFRLRPEQVELRTAKRVDPKDPLYQYEITYILKRGGQRIFPTLFEHISRGRTRRGRPRISRGQLALILEALARGFGTREISRIANVSPATVVNYRRQMEAYYEPNKRQG